MKDIIQSIVEDIRKKREEIFKKNEQLRKLFSKKYNFSIKGKKIFFSRERIEQLRKYKKSILDSIFHTKFRIILSIPFIYAMIIPAIILDIFLFIYQNTALRLYRIPLVKRSDYIVFDRHKLPYLNILQKINCMYCEYFNGLMQYAVEVAGRTEKYWCPIKHAKRKYGEHAWEIYFAPYGDAEKFKKTFCSIKEFENIKNKKS